MRPATSTPRERIIQAAAQLLSEQGRHALTARAVAAAAEAHSPTIYRQFGGMRGLLDAVANRGFDSYLANNVARERHEDPVDDLRSSWDAHVRFGLTHPALYALMFGDPATTIASTAEERAAEMLAELIARIARAGRLRVSEDQANAMIRAAGMGVVLQLLASPADRGSAALSLAVREAVLASVTIGETAGPVDRATPTSPAPSAAVDPDPLVPRAMALRALLSSRLSNVAATPLTAAEAGLLLEWLGRLSDPGSTSVG